VAAIGICFGLHVIVFMLIDGLAVAVSVRVANELGEPLSGCPLFVRCLFFEKTMPSCCSTAHVHSACLERSFFAYAEHSNNHCTHLWVHPQDHCCPMRLMCCVAAAAAIQWPPRYGKVWHVKLLIACVFCAVARLHHMTGNGLVTA
jgi:hypothetical protein